MVLLPDAAIQVLKAGGSLRLSTRAMMPNAMVQYAQAARTGGAKVTFVADGVLLPDTMIQVARR